MANSNICKFIVPSTTDTLNVSYFVLESDRTVMKNEAPLKEHRAILVVSGSGRFVFNGNSTTFTAGSLFFGFEGENFYAAELSDGTVYIYIGFSGSRSDELFKRFDINENNRSFEGFDALIPLWSESLARANELTVDLASESILLYTFSRLFGSAVQNSGVVGKMLTITEERFTDPALSLALIADELSYNVKYLSHIFKEKVGIGYNEFLRDTRVKFAVNLFDLGIDSVKNVAVLSGFTDPLYFSSVFKKKLGVSPIAYIQKNTTNKK